jgi:hypothetical protein
MIILLAGGDDEHPRRTLLRVVGYSHGSARSATRRRQRRALYRCCFVWLQRRMGLAVRLTDAHADP